MNTATKSGADKNCCQEGQVRRGCSLPRGPLTEPHPGDCEAGKGKRRHTVWRRWMWQGPDLGVKEWESTFTTPPPSWSKSHDPTHALSHSFLAPGDRMRDFMGFLCHLTQWALKWRHWWSPWERDSSLERALRKRAWKKSWGVFWSVIRQVRPCLPLSKQNFWIGDFPSVSFPHPSSVHTALPGHGLGSTKENDGNSPTTASCCIFKTMPLCEGN